MIQNEIIEMAKQAGFVEKDAMFRSVYLANIKDLEAFAKLIAEKEREACAKVCESMKPFGLELALQKATMEDCATAIRARGQE